MQDKIFHFFSWFQLLSKTISAKTTYGNPLSFGLYNNSQWWQMIKFEKEKGEISQFSCLSRYSRNLSPPGTMFMLVPQLWYSYPALTPSKIHRAWYFYITHRMVSTEIQQLLNIVYSTVVLVNVWLIIHRVIFTVLLPGLPKVGVTGVVHFWTFLVCTNRTIPGYARTVLPCRPVIIYRV